MNFNEYQEFAGRTAKKYLSLEANLIHAALGIAGEGGEFTDLVKRLAIYEKPQTDETHNHMVEELGDIMWYIALACTHLGVSMEEACEKNIEKCQARYPVKYTNEAAEGRADKGGLDARHS